MTGPPLRACSGRPRSFVSALLFAVAVRADPPPTSQGGHTPTPTVSPAGLGAGGDRLHARWDWYEPTIDGVDDGRVAPALAIALGGGVTPGKPRNRYARAEVVERAGDVLAIVYGSSSRQGEVHLQVSGGACDEVVPVVRRLWPAHRVSRADSALDFVAGFAELDAGVVEFARARGLKHSLTQDSDGGSTRYVGSPTSEVRLRLYKKTEQLRAMHPERADVIPDGIVRAELVARPGKRAVKELVGVMEPDDAWGLGAWSQEFAESVLGLEPARTATHFRRPSDWTRALHFLGQQYGPSIERRAGAVGRDQARLEVLDALGLL